MELLRELFVTAVVAILFSFFIAKLVSKAAASGDHQPTRDSGKNVNREVKEEIIMEELLRSPRRLEVETPETETKTELVQNAATETIEEFVPVEQVVESAPSPVEISETPLPRLVPESASLSVSAVEETTKAEPGHSVTGESINPEETTETVLGQPVGQVESGSRHGEITVTEPVQAVGQSPVQSVSAGETMETVPGQSVTESSEESVNPVETTAAAADRSVGQPVVESSNPGDITEPVAGQSVGESVEEVSKEAEEKSTEEIGGEDSDQKVKDEILATDRESNKKSGVEIDDDWEGIERSELEKEFAEAAKFMESGEKSEGRLGSTGGNDVQMELYGLHKVATEGPCHEQPPMPLKVSARAKWNAWQRLGNMSPEVAMERYIALVSDQVPGWMEEKMAGAGRAGSSEEANDSVKAPDPRTFSSDQPDISDKGDVELESGAKETNLTGGSILEDRAKE